MMARIKDILGDVGDNTASYASRIGCRTSALARDVGPARGGIALGVLAGLIALPFIIRAIRARRMERMEADDEEIIIVEGDETLEPGVTRRPRSRRARKNARRTQGLVY